MIAIQHGHAIFSLEVSFQVEETGLDHQIAMPAVPPPEELPSESDISSLYLEGAPEPVRRYWERERPIELRPVDLRHYPRPRGARAAAACVDQDDRQAARRSAKSTAACSPMPPT